MGDVEKISTLRDPMLLRALGQARTELEMEHLAQLEAAEAALCANLPIEAGMPTVDPKTGHPLITPDELEDNHAYMTDMLDELGASLAACKLAGGEEKIVIGKLQEAYHETVLGNIASEDFNRFVDFYAVWGKAYQALCDAAKKEQRPHLARGEANTSDLFSAADHYGKAAARNDVAIAHLLMAYQLKRGVPLTECFDDIHGYAGERLYEKYKIDGTHEDYEDYMLTEQQAILNDICAPYAAYLPKGDVAPEIPYVIGELADDYMRDHTPKAPVFSHVEALENGYAKAANATANDNGVPLFKSIDSPPVVEAVGRKLRALNVDREGFGRDPFDFLDTVIKMAATRDRAL